MAFFTGSDFPLKLNFPIGILAVFEMCLFFSGFLDFFFSGFLDFLRAPILFLSSIDGVAKLATGIPLAGIGQKSRFRLAGQNFLR